MTGNAIGEQLRQELRVLDTQIAELRGVGRQVGAESDAVRDSEEIAADLTNAEEQEAVLGILERRREAFLDQLRQLDA
jgi:4-aminobutyrate aminotransferase-like enzyme